MRRFTVVVSLLVLVIGAGCSVATAPQATATAMSPRSSTVPIPTPTVKEGQAAPATATTAQARGTLEPLLSATPQIEETMATTAEPGTTTELPQVTFAREDLALRLNLAPEAIEVLEVELRTWPDASLGCPLPGMAYAQVLQEGLLIRLQAQGQIYNYHSGGGDPFLCDQSNIPQKSTPPLDIELMTQPPPT